VDLLLNIIFLESNRDYNRIAELSVGFLIISFRKRFVPKLFLLDAQIYRGLLGWFTLFGLGRVRDEKIFTGFFGFLGLMVNELWDLLRPVSIF
jgi:hypothetical protein